MRKDTELHKKTDPNNSESVSAKRIFIYFAIKQAKAIE